jgi:methylase of polypeptide subunit release factors
MSGSTWLDDWLHDILFARSIRLRARGGPEIDFAFNPYRVLMPDFMSFSLGLAIGQRLSPELPTVLDIGVGSGIFPTGVILGASRRCSLTGLDIDPQALTTAANNIEAARMVTTLGTHHSVTLLESDWLARPMAEGRRFHWIYLNPPFKPDDEPVRYPAAMAPRQALYGGPDGLDAYRAVLPVIHQVAQPYARLFVRTGNSEHETRAVLDLLLEYQAQHITREGAADTPTIHMYDYTMPPHDEGNPAWLDRGRCLIATLLPR